MHAVLSCAGLCRVVLDVLYMLLSHGHDCAVHAVLAVLCYAGPCLMCCMCWLAMLMTVRRLP